MAATNKDRNTVHKGTELLPVVMAAGVVIPAGVIVVANAAGYATNGATAVGLTYLGMADEAAENTGGADGARQVIVRRERAFKFANFGADLVTQASLGKPAYIVDNQTVAATNGGNTRSPAGIVLGVEADGVWIR
jgi:hypothetical protein